MSEKTPWFPYNVNPVHVGEYEVGNSRPMHWNANGRLVGSNRRYWNGRRWMAAAPGDVFGSEPSIMGTHESQQWRGLTKPHGAA